MKLSVRKRNIIIQLCQEAIDSGHKDKNLNKNIRSIQRNMRASIADTELKLKKDITNE